MSKPTEAEIRALANELWGTEYRWYMVAYAEAKKRLKAQPKDSPDQ